MGDLQINYGGSFEWQERAHQIRIAARKTAQEKQAALDAFVARWEADPEGTLIDEVIPDIQHRRFMQPYRTTEE